MITSYKTNRRFFFYHEHLSRLNNNGIALLRTARFWSLPDWGGGGGGGGGVPRRTYAALRDREFKDADAGSSLSTSGCSTLIGSF